MEIFTKFLILRRYHNQPLKNSYSSPRKLTVGALKIVVKEDEISEIEMAPF